MGTLLIWEVSKLATEHDITLLKLPSHLTHLLQPLDLSVFKPMKTKWDEVTADFTRRNRIPVKKKNFPSLLNEVWKHYDEASGKNGFRKAGIIPFNKDIVSKDVLQFSEPYTCSQQPASNSQPLPSTGACSSQPLPPTSQLLPPIAISQPSSGTNQSLPSYVSQPLLLPLPLITIPPSGISQPLTGNNHPLQLALLPSGIGTCNMQPSTCNQTLPHGPIGTIQDNSSSQLSSARTCTGNNPLLPPSLPLQPVHHTEPPTCQSTDQISLVINAPSSVGPSSTSTDPESCMHLYTVTEDACDQAYSTSDTIPCAASTQCDTLTGTPLTGTCTSTGRSPLSNIYPTPAVSKERELRCFFADLLATKDNATRNTSRRRVAGNSESLTSEEVMKRLRDEDENKRQKEREKEERKQKREERKRKISAQAAGKTKKTKKLCKSVEKPKRYICLECETYFNKDEDNKEEWIECKKCLNWFHIACTDSSCDLDLAPEDEAELSYNFICNQCM